MHIRDEQAFREWLGKKVYLVRLVIAILVTGAAGFIGSNFVIDWLAGHDETVISLDKLTYAGNLSNLEALNGINSHIFVKGDIGNQSLVKELLSRYEPRAQYCVTNKR